MSNARIQFSLASEEMWLAYNPFLKEGEIVTSVKANKKVKLVQGKIGGSNYSDSTVIWDQDNAESLTSRSETAATTAATKSSSAASSASAAAASQAAAANSASAAAGSATAAKNSETAAKASETAGANSASAASSSESNAAASAEAAQSAASNAAASAEAAVQKATAAATSAETATAKATAAADSASAANDSAITATAKATAAANSASAANNYAANAKNYSENVNVFLPSVSDSGVLSWTNKAGLANPASVNIKGAKGDKGDKGDKGTAATIEVGTVTTGAAGSSASVTNSGTASNVVLNFTLPRGKDGKGSVITVNGKEPDASGNVNVEEYTHPNSGVTAGTYRSVTVNAQGHVTGGSNPTLAIANGGTGATTASAALSNLGGVPTSEVANSANKIPRYNSSGHLVLPDGSEFWIA